MTDTQFADVSEWNPSVDFKLYPYDFISIRSNDGTYQDKHFAYNLALTKHAADTRQLVGFMVYFVWEPNWQDTLATFKAMVGTPHPEMAVMIDVESWKGKITGDHSVQINATREVLISWLGGNRKRVIGYGNAHDLNTLWVTRGDTNIVLANYSDNPAFPRKIAHQYSDKFNVPPFGLCDINSADGVSPVSFAGILGLTVAPKPPAPKPVRKPYIYTVQNGDSLVHIAAKYHMNWTKIYAANRGIIGHDPNRIIPGQKLVIPGHYV